MAVDLVTMLRTTFGLELEETFFIYSPIWKKRYTAKFRTSGLMVEDCPHNNELVLFELLFNPKCTIEKTTSKVGAVQAMNEIGTFLTENDGIRGARESKSALSYVRAYIDNQTSASSADAVTIQSLNDKITELNGIIANKDATIQQLNINWTPSLYYTVDDVVKYESKYYVCCEGHTSLDNFETDKWQLVKAVINDQPPTTGGDGGGTDPQDPPQQD